MKKLFLIIAFFLQFIYLQAQDLSPRKIALLPVLSNGIDYASAKTAESILRMELTKQKSIDIITERRTLDAMNNEDCFDEECAKTIGSKIDADEVLLCKLNALGEKIIVQYLLVETSTGENLLAEQTSALNLDDLEPVMKRVAISVSRKSVFDANSEVGNIVGNESVESLRKASRYNFGVGFGYLFPIEGYDSDDKSFTINAYFDYEIKDYAVGLMAGARDGFAINLYGAYLFSKTDASPYLGTSLGLHWVDHSGYYNDYYYDEFGNYYSNYEEKSGDGIEIGFNGGVRLLHTYNVQLFINFEYIMTFNDYNDKAFIFTIGIL